jgi:hypothetical protein
VRLLSITQAGAIWITTCLQPVLAGKVDRQHRDARDQGQGRSHLAVMPGKRRDSERYQSGITQRPGNELRGDHAGLHL